jgi:large subunit ribosomal protein L17
MFVEPLINRSKEDSTHSRRVAFRYLKNKYAVTELFREVAPKVADRPGGFTRIIRTGYRLGDSAEMCMIELVDFNELYGSETEKKTRSRRSRRGGAKKAVADAAGKVEEAADSAATAATDAAEGVAEKAADVAEEAKEATAEVVEDVKEEAEAATDATEDKLADAEDSKEESDDKDDANDEKKDA